MQFKPVTTCGGIGNILDLMYGVEKLLGFHGQILYWYSEMQWLYNPSTFTVFKPLWHHWQFLLMLFSAISGGKKESTWMRKVRWRRVLARIMLPEAFDKICPSYLVGDLWKQCLDALQDPCPFFKKTAPNECYIMSVTEFGWGMLIESVWAPLRPIYWWSEEALPWVTLVNAIP